MHVKTALLSCALMLGAGTAAQATTTLYTDQAAYLAAITAGTAVTDSYDDLAIAYYGSPITRSVGGYSYQASADGGLYGAGEGGDGWLSTSNQPDAIHYAHFTGGVSAIGGTFFGSDINGHFAPIGEIALTFTDAHGVQSVLQTAWPTQGNFLGFVSSDGIQSLDVQVTGFALPDGMTPEEAAAYFQWPTVNNLILGQSPQDAPPPQTGDVPETGSWALMLAGFGLVGCALRASRRRVVSFG